MPDQCDVITHSPHREYVSSMTLMAHRKMQVRVVGCMFCRVLPCVPDREPKTQKLPVVMFVAAHRAAWSLGTLAPRFHRSPPVSYWKPPLDC